MGLDGRSVAGDVGLLQRRDHFRLDRGLRRRLGGAGVGRTGRQVALGRGDCLGPGDESLRFGGGRGFGGIGVGGAGRQVAFRFCDRFRARVCDLDLRLGDPPNAATAAARIAGGRGFLAAFLLRVVSAAAAGAEQPGEDAKSAARHLHLAAAGFDLRPRLLVAGHRLSVGRDEHRLSVREEPRHRVPAHPRPIADRTAVDMHPGRDAGRVKADAAVLHAHGDVADARGADVDEMGVDRLAFHVLRMFGHLPRPAAQHGVRLRRAVCRKNVDRLCRPRLAVDLPDDVEQVGVHLGRLVEPPVAAEPVQLVENRLVIDAVDHERERAGLIGVLVRQYDGPRVAVGDRRFGRVRDDPGRNECRSHRQLRRRPAAAGAHDHLETRQQTILPQHGATGGEAGGLCLPVPYAYALAGFSPAGPYATCRARVPRRAIFGPSHCDEHVTVRQKAICANDSPISRPFQS